MMRWIGLAALLSHLCFGQQPAKNSEAAAVGLRGPVHSVLTEGVFYQDNPQGKPAGSTFVIYDPSGYLLEEFRYEPDGTPHSHTKYMRKGWQVFKTETTSVIPNENRTFTQSFNSNGLVTGTDMYDGSGLLIAKTKNDLPPQPEASTISSSQTMNADGTVSISKTVESSNAATGITRQTTTKDGKPYVDWLIQRDSSGKPVTDALRFEDGSFNEREVKPDGTVVEHKYWAPTKTDTYQTTDSKNRVVELINDSAGEYTKTTYRYDEAGRQTEIANYDRSGKLLRKSLTRYQEDANGNWSEEKEFHWDVTLGSKPPKLVYLSHRIVTYY